MTPIQSTTLRPTLVWGLLLLLILTSMPVASGQSLPAFRKKFEGFVTADDYTSMKALIKDSKDLAFNLAAVYDQLYCRAMLASEDETAKQIDNFYDQLTVVYKLEFRNDRFLMNRRKWMTTLDATGQQGLLDFFSLWNDGYDAFSKASRDGGDEGFKKVVPKLMAALEKAKSIQDFYYCAHTSDLLSKSHDGFLDNFGMVFWALHSYKFAVRAGVGNSFASVRQRVDIHKSKSGRDTIRSPELIDLDLEIEAARAKFTIDVKQASEVKIGDGSKGEVKVGPSDTGSGKTLSPPSTKADYEWLEEKGFKVGRPFKPTGKIKLPYVRPGLGSTNPSYQPFILGMTVKKDQKELDFPMIPGALIDYEGKLKLDPDGEQGKQKYKPLRLKKKLTVQSFNALYDDGTKAKLSFELMSPPTSFKVFGLPFKSDVTGKALIYWRGVTTVEGQMRGRKVTFIDSSGNGLFDDPGVDTVMVGDGKNARVDPYGRYVFLEEDDGWFPYEIKMATRNASVIRTRPYRGDLAPIQLVYKGGKRPEYLIVQGTGEDAAFFFDIMKATDDLIWVPPGSFMINHGYFIEGKGRKQKHMLIARGRSTPFQVAIGKINKWEIGGSGEKGFWLYGGAKRGGDNPSEIEVIGKEIKVYGNWGEEYHSFYDLRLDATITLRAGDAKGRRIGGKVKMKMPSGNSVTVVDAFYPATTTIKGAPRKGKLVFQLNAKHKWLGPMKSDWIEVAEF